jgi:hypothetical protein
VIPIPPTAEILETLQSDVLPGAGGAALVVCAFALLGRWAGVLGSAVAVVVGFAWGNFNFTKLAWEDTGRLLSWKLADDAVGYEYLLRATLLLVVVGLVSRWLGIAAARVLPEPRWWVANVLVWLPRTAAVIVVSGWLTVGDAAKEWTILCPQLAFAMLLIWCTLDALARLGAGAQVAAYQGAALFTAGLVFLHAQSLKSAELAIVLGSAMYGVAVATAAIALHARRPDGTRVPIDASGAVPAGVAFLPGLMFGARPWLTEHAVPPACFWLVALTPLLLLPFVLPPLCRKSGWYIPVSRAVLVVIPLVVALVVVRQYAQMAFEE